MHLGDDAQRYALGELPLADRPRIEAHLAECATCRSNVAEAERVAWTLASALAAPQSAAPQRPAVRVPSWAMSALAALFALAFLGQTYRAQTLATSVAATSTALQFVAASHFFHADFTPTGAPLTAKAIYARDGAWLYVVVASPDIYRVASEEGPQHSELGTTLRVGESSSLFVKLRGRPKSLVLLRGVAVAARVALAYAEPSQGR